MERAAENTVHWTMYVDRGESLITRTFDAEGGWDGETDVREIVGQVQWELEQGAKSVEIRRG